MREEYLAAKQNNRIIESLELLATPSTRKAAKLAHDWRNEIAEIVKLTSQLKGQKQFWRNVIRLPDPFVCDLVMAGVTS